MQDLSFRIFVLAAYLIGTPIDFIAWVWQNRPFFVVIFLLCMGLSTYVYRKLLQWNRPKKLLLLVVLNMFILSGAWLSVPSKFRAYEVEVRDFIKTFPRPESTTISSSIINPYGFEGMFYDPYNQGSTVMWIYWPRPLITEGSYEEQLEKNVIMGLTGASWEDITPQRRELEAFYRNALSEEWEEMPQYYPPTLLTDYEEILECTSGRIPTALFLEGGKFAERMGKDPTPNALTNHPSSFAEYLNNIKFCECQKKGSVSWATMEDRQFCSELPMEFRRKNRNDSPATIDYLDMNFRAGFIKIWL